MAEQDNKTQQNAADDPASDVSLPDAQRGQRRLSDAVRKVRSLQADRNDVVVDLAENERARLSLLAEDLKPLFDDIDGADERFELALAQGERPRLWVDMTSFVAMGHDKRSYRFIKDTRMGRMVLAETGDKERMADFVSEYVAERVLDRERALEGDREVLSRGAPQDRPAAIRKRKGSRNWLWFLAGIAVALAVMFAAAFLMVPEAF